MPYLKIPTADDALGNDEAEGGLILPFSMALGDEWTLGAMLDLGVVRASADDRHVWDLGHTVTVSRGLFGDLGGFLEYAGFVSLNADGDYRGSLDTGLTYAISGDVQLDAGVRLGLTRADDDIGVFAGISLRY
ncbi:MAG: transporter [Phycisphaerae bacterium]|nr:transporter [Phycisphaerae bacterium]